MRKIAYGVATVLMLGLVGCGANDDMVVDDQTVELSEESENDIQEDTEEETTEANVDGEVLENFSEVSEIGGEESTKDETAGRELLTDKSGLTDDYTLYVGNRIIDFSKMAESLAVERRSETLVVVTDSSDLSINYSSSGVTVGTTDKFDLLFPKGYETINDPNWGDLLYGVEEESDGNRIVVLQDIGGESYLSIRVFDKSKSEPLDIIDSVKLKSIDIYEK